jgi:hypothetical protein
MPRWRPIDENQELDRSPATEPFALAADGKAVASLMKIRNWIDRLPLRRSLWQPMTKKWHH